MTRSMPPGIRRDAAGQQFEVVVLDGLRPCLVSEVGVVGADRHALVAVDAVVEPELRPDLARHALIVLPRVAWIGRRFGHQDRRIQQSRGVHVTALPAVLLTNSAMLDAPTSLHLGAQILQIADQARVAAGPQQIGAGGHRDEVHGHRRRHVVRVESAGEGNRDRQPARARGNFCTRFIASTCSGAPGHVHQFVAEDVLVILHHQRVGELQRKAPAVPVRHVAAVAGSGPTASSNCRSFSKAGGWSWISR